MTTFELARAVGVQAESLRKAVARQGHYFGLVPTKLLNGRLLWPADAVAQLQKGGAKMTECPLDRMERIMKNALASSNQLTLEHAKTLGIGEWAFGDVMHRLYFQGFKVNYADRNGTVIKITKNSQLKLIKQGFRQKLDVATDN